MKIPTVNSVFGTFTLKEIKKPNCRKCKDKVCYTDETKCEALVKFIKAVRG